MGSAFDGSLERLFSSLKATCDAAIEKGGSAIVHAASVDIPSQINAFIARESVAQTPSRLRALSAGLGSSLLIDIATLRSSYFSAGKDGGKEGSDATTHARVLTLQALLSLQLGSMCLLPGISRLRVAAREKDPLPKALLKRVGRYLGDLQLKQALGPSSSSSPPASSDEPPASAMSIEEPSQAQGPVEAEPSFDSLVTDTLVALFGRRYPLSLLYLYTLLDCEVPSSMAAENTENTKKEEGKGREKEVKEKQVKGEGGVKKEEEEDTLVLRRPKKGAKRPADGGEGAAAKEGKEESGRKKEEAAGDTKGGRRGRQASFKPKYSPEAYPHLPSAASKPGSSDPKDTASTKESEKQKAKEKEKEKGTGLGGGGPLKRGRGSAHYLNRSLSGLRKVTSTTTSTTTGLSGGGTGLMKGGPVKAFKPLGGGGEKGSLREGARGREREKSGVEKKVMSPSRRFSPRLNRKVEGRRVEGEEEGEKGGKGGRLLDEFCADVLGTPPAGGKRKRRVVLGSPDVEVSKAQRGGGLFGMGRVGDTPEPPRGGTRTRRSVAGTPN